MKDNSRQVEVATYENEPLARLSEQRLYQAGIPCVLKSLQGGSGLWGSAYNVPHSLYVYENHLDEATEILGLDSIISPSGSDYTKQWPSWLVLGIVLVVVLVLVSATSAVRLI
ncbi:MAG: DUF2007 domain-containing protein [Dehalococcoidia bacterium]|nr:DUF2007 domain-containing protein [Dehalococcoidia bacterium]